MINFIEDEKVDLRTVEYRITNGGGSIVARLEERGDVILIYSIQNRFYEDETLPVYGVVHSLMDGYISSHDSDYHLAQAMERAFTLMAIELMPSAVKVQVIV